MLARFGLGTFAMVSILALGCAKKEQAATSASCQPCQEDGCDCSATGCDCEHDHDSAAGKKAGLYGAAFGDASVTPLSKIAADPASFDGKSVTTEGTVATVCKKMGCWIELSADGVSEPIRVPMAGHAFTVPKDSAGKRCRVHGKVSTVELTQAMKDHLAAEGATVTERAASINAEGVLFI